MLDTTRVIVCFDIITDAITLMWEKCTGMKNFNTAYTKRK